MTSTRTSACIYCRLAKVKCDCVRPQCGRCVQRRLICTGYTADGEYIFRNENMIAQRNSRLARRDARHIVLALECAATDSHMTNRTRGPQFLRAGANNEFWTHFDWRTKKAISNIPKPLERDAETRAIERFLAISVTFPNIDGISPGCIRGLPTLYQMSPPNSFFSCAVRTLAFADVKNNGDGNNTVFWFKARQNYGESLVKLRALVDKPEEFGNDAVVVGLILIDSFEALYLARPEPLSPHNAAYSFIFEYYYDEMLRSRCHFELWRLANEQLQAGQILLQEKPNIYQLKSVGALNTEIPYNRVAVDALRISELSAAVKRIMQLTAHPQIAERTSISNEARHILSDIQDLIDSSSSWRIQTEDMRKPNYINLQVPAQQILHYSPGHPSRCYSRSALLTDADIWLAYMWGFHSACQIVLREALITVSIAVAGTEQEEHTQPSSRNFELIQANQNAIASLSGFIIKSLPPHAKLPEKAFNFWGCASQEMIAGRRLVLFAMSVIERAQYTPAAHKDAASKVKNLVMRKS